MATLQSMAEALTLDLFGNPVSDDPAARKSQSEVSRLLKEIAACQEDIRLRESFALDLEMRLRKDLDPLEDRIKLCRLETFRILAGHVRQSRLRKRSREALVDALCDFADELHYGYGLDVEAEMRGILPEGESEELQEVLAALFEGWEEAVSAAGEDSGSGRPEIPDDPGQAERPRAGRRGRKPHGARSQAALKRESEQAALAGDIRALYLLLARALHPDKETDSARAAEKTGWMQQVTAAYQARDLGGLMGILARNPLDAVGPYLLQAQAKTAYGFAKRLRREVQTLRQQAQRVGDHFHPLFAKFVRDRRVDEPEYRRFRRELEKKVRFYEERCDLYRELPAVEEMLGLLKNTDWRLLM